ncbi:type I-C CRISPR-associated protein Cas8c/Csd1 [Alkalihalobacillus sp. 1P02AB]|uniref:type I-C CRISPR-associated protein Cas8c/Csd1 n=1 Tax=Alkalihalobacillus sp. 1P02AB TaxID=3132260 RepID=UPI0039A5A93A
MSLFLSLYQTYQNNSSEVGDHKLNRFAKEYTLIPVSHTTQTAHIEVLVTEEGKFHSAEIIPKGNGNTLIPATKESASRAGSVIAPYPLHDKLSYVAGDYVKYGGVIKKEEPYSAYIVQLEEWANSPHNYWMVNSIFNYLKKGRLIEDLVNEKKLHLDSAGKLITSWDKKYEELFDGKPDIFSVVAGGQEGAFIRFSVYSPTKVLPKVWQSKEVFDSFTSFYNQSLGDEDLCYVSNEWLPKTNRHANKIRNAGDKAKLISDNDKNGFTYRGRFRESDQVATISYEVSQKAHNALKWLINRQAKIVDGRVFLVWGNQVPEVPDPTSDSFDIYEEWDESPEEPIQVTNTHQNYATEVKKALSGYINRLKELDTNEQINILVLDSATTGRLAVLYYRNIQKELYVKGLINWHSRCKWLHRYRKDNEGKRVHFIGAPSTKDIAFATYGPNANEKVVKGLMERLLPCIVDEQPIPSDIVRSAIQRASNPVALENWEWEKTLSIACALINSKEDYDMAVDNNNDDRNYLFGRLLAVADVLERNVLDSNGEKRATNATRYMNSFANRPERTWKTIQAALQPYLAKLGKGATRYTRIIDEISSKFKVDDFNNRPLTGKFLLGLSSQRHDMYQKKEKVEQNEGRNE